MYYTYIIIIITAIVLWYVVSSGDQTVENVVTPYTYNIRGVCIYEGDWEVRGHVIMFVCVEMRKGANVGLCV